MLLSRLAVIRLTRPAPARLARWSYTTSAGISVFTKELHVQHDITDAPERPEGGPTLAWPRESDRAVLLVASRLEVGKPSIDSSRLVRLPEEPRRELEGAIGEFADMLGVVYPCRREVLSTKPCVMAKGRRGGGRIAEGGSRDSGTFHHAPAAHSPSRAF